MRLVVAAVVAITVSVISGSAVRAQTMQAPPSIAWVQWEADGRPHARAIVHDMTCPSLTSGTASLVMAERAAPGDAFDDRVCDVALPADYRRGRIGTIALPSIPRAPKRIAMFGDSGCRLKGLEVQDCNDPVKWPFPTVARDIANEHPDLVIHVGDYYYRESACPPLFNCANSPHGDNSESWNADYFAPMVPLFAAAPIINARGNHEDCKRSAHGWIRYLSGISDAVCIPHEPPAFVEFDNLLIGNVDDVTETTELLFDPPVWKADLAIVQARALQEHRQTWLVSHRPAVTYLGTHPQNPEGSAIDAYISGHLHLFGAYSFRGGGGPQVIVGTGGDTLASPAEVELLRILGGTTERRFGYALFIQDGGNWNIEVHDVDAKLHRRCRMVGRQLTCGAPLTATR